MKSFEERYTSWVDGALSEEECAIFEREHSFKEKAELRKLGSLMRANLRREVPHPDFFNAQLLAEIERQQIQTRARAGHWLGIPRLAWGGLVTLACGLALFFTIVPHGDLSDPRTGYVAEVLKTKTGKREVTATVDSQKGMTIIKLNGLDRLPAEKDPSR
jgi:hypothetical protein